MYKQTSCSDILFIADPDQAETLRISTSENLIQLRQSRFFQVSLNTPYTEGESAQLKVHLFWPLGISAYFSYQNATKTWCRSFLNKMQLFLIATLQAAKKLQFQMRSLPFTHVTLSTHTMSRVSHPRTNPCLVTHVVEILVYHTAYVL